MKILGIILLILEVVAVIGGILNGSLSEMTGNAEFVKLIGFFIPGIIGAVLLSVSVCLKKKSNK